MYSLTIVLTTPHLFQSLATKTKELDESKLTIFFLFDVVDTDYAKAKLTLKALKKERDLGTTIKFSDEYDLTCKFSSSFGRRSAASCE